MNAKIEDLETHFWKKVDVGEDSDCWNWLEGTFSSGYGQVGSRTTPEKRSHRLAYHLTYGPIPKNLLVCHTCDNPICCNPSHLFLGDHSANQADKKSKGRQARGESVWHLSKFCDDEIREIRKRYANRRLKKRDPVDGVRALAKEYGVHDQAIRHIVTYKTWNHIEDKNDAS